MAVAAAGAAGTVAGLSFVADHALALARRPVTRAAAGALLHLVSGVVIGRHPVAGVLVHNTERVQVALGDSAAGIPPHADAGVAELLCG